jgi:hypothetical protein
MTIETRFRIKPGGRYYTMAQTIVDSIRAPEKGIHAQVEAGVLRVVTRKPLNPDLAQSIVDLFKDVEAGRTIDNLDILVGS